MKRRAARIDRVVMVTRPVALEVDAQTATVVATRWGLVLVQREEGWTWFRWVMAGRSWSVTVDRALAPPVAMRVAARLMGKVLERYRRR